MLTVTTLTRNAVKKKVTVTSLPLITVYKNLSSLSYFNDHKIRSLITTVNPQKIFGVRRHCRRRRPSPPSTVAAVDRRRQRCRRRRLADRRRQRCRRRRLADSPYRRVGESAI